jgi:flagellar biogenesis protein FliO
MSASEVIRLAVSLILVVGGLFVVRRWSRSGRPGRRVSGHSRVPIRIVGRVGISRGVNVAVVEVDNHRFLVGAGEHGVNLLAELAPRPDTETAVDDISFDPSTLDHHSAFATDGEPRDHMYADALTDTSASNQPRMGLVARLQHTTLRTSGTSRPRATPL